MSAADPLESFRRQSDAIGQRLTKALERRVASGGIGARAKMGGSGAVAATRAVVSAGARE